MALYDGFFDAVLDEDTYQYDREYDSGSFTEYYANLIGSGVCIHNNTDSMLVTWDGTAAVMAPGYLFIDGHWLKNTANYSVPVSGEGTYAILATLNMGTRRIEVETQPKADPEEYPDSLCLAYVTIDSAGAAAVEDTRYNTDICGVIDTAGALSGKIEYVINYIDNEINAKLEQAEADIAAQAAVLDAKVAEVSAMVEKLAPPPIGTVKFSASSEIEDGWLRCDGSFISETDYPELVAALGKKYPSGDKFVVLSEGEIGQNISNAAVYDGKIWVFSLSSKSLVGVDIETGDLTVLSCSGDEYFGNFITPTVDQPLVLSIVPHLVGTGARVFLTQVIKEGTSGTLGNSTTESTDSTDIQNYFLLYSADLAESDGLSFSRPLQIIPHYYYSNVSSSYALYEHAVAHWTKELVPYVTSKIEDNIEVYQCIINYSYGRWSKSGSATSFSETTSSGAGAAQLIFWSDESTTARNTAYSNTISIPSKIGQVDTNDASSGIRYQTFQRYGLSPGNAGDSILISSYYRSVPITNEVTVYSQPNALFSPGLRETSFPRTGTFRTARGPLNVAGATAVLYDIQTTAFCVCRLDRIEASQIVHGVKLPSAARVFVDAGLYLNGKDIYIIFVGTGMLFSRNLTNDDVGYLETIDTLGTITQYASLLHTEDENTLFIVGQDSRNKVVVAKMVLNTLFDYATDGAWLPHITSNGVPAYIKALDTTTEEA